MNVNKRMRSKEEVYGDEINLANKMSNCGLL